jgi:hypothetical protein
MFRSYPRTMSRNEYYLAVESVTLLYPLRKNTERPHVITNDDRFVRVVLYN